MFSENEEYEDEELEEIESETLEDCGCKNFGNMDFMRMFDKSMGFLSRCDDCECYDRCFEETYGESEETHASIKRDEDLEHVENFLNGLPKERLSIDFCFSKPRKIVKVGQLSHGITIPRILNQVYQRGSEVLTFWSGESKTLLFFGVGSFVSEGNREILKNLFLNGQATFRNVVFMGKLNVLIIPRQFMQYFNASLKVNPQFDSSANVLFFRSNLTDLEYAEVDREKQAKSYLVHSSVAKTDSKRLGFKDSREYRETEKFKRGL